MLSCAMLSCERSLGSTCHLSWLVIVVICCVCSLSVCVSLCCTHTLSLCPLHTLSVALCAWWCLCLCLSVQLAGWCPSSLHTLCSLSCSLHPPSLWYSVSNCEPANNCMLDLCPHVLCCLPWSCVYKRSCCIVVLCMPPGIQCISHACCHTAQPHHTGTCWDSARPLTSSSTQQQCKQC